MVRPAALPPAGVRPGRRTGDGGDEECDGLLGLAVECAVLDDAVLQGDISIEDDGRVRHRAVEVEDLAELHIKAIEALVTHPWVPERA